MADDLARRREIRRRKILESSEARLNKITSNNGKKLQGDSKEEADEIAKNHDPEEEYDNLSRSVLCGIKVRRKDFSVVDESSNLNQAQSYEDHVTRNRLVENDTFHLHSSNGDFARSCSPDSYTFPKKVSDAETRSFGRTRSDVRRNSSCTQIMMETLQFSSVSLTVLRFWLVAMAAFLVKVNFLLMEVLPIFQTIFFPFLLLEVAIFSWSKLEAQELGKIVRFIEVSGFLKLFCSWFGSNWFVQDLLPRL